MFANKVHYRKNPSIPFFSLYFQTFVMNIYLSININYMMTHLQHDVPAGWIGSNKENLNQTSLTIRMQQKI